MSKFVGNYSFYGIFRQNYFHTSKNKGDPQRVAHILKNFIGYSAEVFVIHQTGVLRESPYDMVPTCVV